MVLRYRYAEDEASQLVDVQLLTRDTRHILGPYRCLSCGDRLIPALGEKVAHHFRHKTEQACNRETYLHRTAKLVFLEAFMAAVASGRPYLVHRPRAEVCRRHEARFGKTCSFRERMEPFDLTRWVSRARLEAPIDGFVADVLLENEDGTVRLLIEMAVTHPCSPEKIASGLRIIEIPIHDEESIALLKQGITLQGGWARDHNLAERPPMERDSCTDCPHRVTLFVVYGSGKSFLGDFSLEEAAQTLARPTLIHHEVTSWAAERGEDRPIEIVARHVAKARYEARVPVRSCTLCRRGGYSWYPEEAAKPIRCFERQAYVGYNEAATCKDYLLFPSREKLEAERRLQKGKPRKSTRGPVRPLRPAF